MWSSQKLPKCSRYTSYQPLEDPGRAQGFLTRKYKQAVCVALLLSLLLCSSFWARANPDFLHQIRIARQLSKNGYGVLSPSFSAYGSDSTQNRPVPTIKADFFKQNAASTPDIAAISAFPRRVVLEPTAPKPEEMLFVIATGVERARNQITYGLWQHFMAGGPSCLILLPPNEFNKVEYLKSHLRSYNLPCIVKVSILEAYTQRVLSLPKEAEDLVKDFKWLVMGDDDTLWFDQRILRRMLGKYDADQMHFIASTSERHKSLGYFGRMSYGGGGLIMSSKLVKRYAAEFPECLKRWPRTFGGDEAVNNCAAMVQDIENREKAFTEELGMHQLDILGLTSGFLQSGVPMLNIHHFFSWARLMPDWMHSRDDYKILAALLKAAKFLGGDNMFTRYSFNDGRTILVNGYSITAYLEPLTAEDHERMEVTWGYGEDVDLTFSKTRHPITELGDQAAEWDLPGRQRKSTYYLQDVRIVDADRGQGLFVYIVGEKR